MEKNLEEIPTEEFLCAKCGTIKEINEMKILGNVPMCKKCWSRLGKQNEVQEVIDKLIFTLNEYDYDKKMELISEIDKLLPN